MFILLCSAPPGIKPQASEHHYDYADVGGSDLSDRRRANQEAQRQIIKAVENPYYGGDDIENESGGTGHLGASNVVNIKVTDNPYYGM